MIPQGTPEWFTVRLGKVTASRVADVVTRTKTGWGAARASYMNQLVAERLTGRIAEGYVSPAMQWGVDHQSKAQLAYQFRHDTEVLEASFVEHPEIAMSGASPDGYCGSDGLVEFKCPTTPVHLSSLIEGSIPDRYVCQMLWQLACTERSWCDFVSYDPRLPEGMRLFVQRLHRDDQRVIELEAMVEEFLAEVEHLTGYLQQHYSLRHTG